MSSDSYPASTMAQDRDSELDLMRHWPAERPQRQWIAVLAASIVIHVGLFSLAVQLPAFAGRTPPTHRVIVHHIPLYMPPDLLTQRAPNRQKIAKSIDLASLLATEDAQARQARSRPPSTRRFEMPKEVERQQLAKSTPPQILPAPPPKPPVVVPNATDTPVPGTIAALRPPTPPPPVASQSPFQNVGSDAPPNPHPTLRPPKPEYQAPVSKPLQDGNGQHMVVSEDSPMEMTPASPGSLARPGDRHAGAAVELQSDPQGADFRKYLAEILRIVRANWRHVIPESARLGTVRGRTTLEFIIDRNGSIPKLVVSNSSGSDPLDRAAISGLSMSNPLPPLPADFKGFQVRLAFSFTYNMPTQ